MRNIRNIAVPVLILMLALAARLPYLLLIPRFTDEIRFMQIATQLNQGASWPLVYPKTGYNGPGLLLLLALARLIRPEVDTPRVLMLVLGSSSVALVYAIGWLLHSRLAGLVAATLAMTSFVTILVFSHVAWYVSLSVPLELLTWLLVVLTARQGQGRWLVVAGLTGGLAIQQYPLVAVFVPTLLVWLVLQPRSRGLLLGRAGLAAAVIAMVVYSPILAYHLPRLVRGQALDLGGGYDQVTKKTELVSYPVAVGAFATAVLDGLGGVNHLQDLGLAGDGLTLFMGGLALAGLVYSARRGESLPALLFVFATLLTPILIRDYDFPMRTRYAAIVFPALYLGLGAAVSMLVCDLKTRSLAAQIVVACMLLAALGLAAVVPLVRLGQYYDGQVAVGRTNEALLRVLAYSREAHLPVVLDGKILSTNTVNGNPSNVLEALFQWQNIEVHRLDSVEGLGQYLHAQATPVLVIVSDAHLAQLGMGDRLFPEPGGMVSAINDVEGYGLYRSVPAY